MTLTSSERSTEGPGDRPLRWLRTVKLLSATQLAMLVGFNFSFPFLPLFIQDLGVHDRAELALWSGVAVGSAGLAMALASPLWGLLADRFGRKAMLLRSVASGSILLAIQSTLSNVWELAAIRVMQGALTGTQTAGAMLLAGIVPAQRTGFALGLLNTAVQAGNLVGPVVGGLAVASVGLRGSFLIGAAMLAACAVVTAVYIEDGPRVRREDLPVGLRGNARDLFAPFAWPGLRGVLVIGLAIQVAFAGTVGVLAIYVQDLARPPWLETEVAIGLAFALGALASAVAMPFLGSYADRREPRVLLIVSLALVGVGLVPQTIFPNAVLFLICRLPVGVGLAGTTTALAVLTRRGAIPGGEGRAFGAFATSQNLGWGIGPIAGSTVAAAFGIPALYVAGAIALVGLAAVSAVKSSWFPLADDSGVEERIAGQAGTAYS